jgi:hypothetical protein
MLRSAVVLCLAAIPMLAGGPSPVPGVPEPATIVLVGGGLVAAALFARARHSRK